MRANMIRYTTFKIPPILAMLRLGKKTTWLGQFNVKLHSLRLQAFLHKGTDCKHCRLKGLYFGLDAYLDVPNKPHLNLYGRRNGEEILITHDHIIARAFGGLNTLENIQTLCDRCNNKKSIIEGEIYKSVYGDGRKNTIRKVKTTK